MLAAPLKSTMRREPGRILLSPLGTIVLAIALGLCGGYLDLVVMTDVLEHLDDPAGALGAVRARLKPGGALLMTVPATPWLWSAHDVTHHHRRRYRAPRSTITNTRKSKKATPSFFLRASFPATKKRSIA